MKAKYKKYKNKKNNFNNRLEIRQDKKTLFIALTLIVVLGIIVYANSLTGKFIWDDQPLIKGNIAIKNLSRIVDCFTKDISGRAGATGFFYRPMQTLTYVLDHAIWKLNVTGYHLTNILLHILVALCIYWLIDILYNDKTLSFLTSVLFVVHPIHTEAVSYISGRADSLATLFVLLCFINYIRLIDKNRVNILNYVLVLLTYACALLSKEMSLILPLLLLLYHTVFKKKIKIIEFLSLVAIAAIYIVTRFTYLKSMLPQLSSDTVFERLPGLFVAILNYIKLFFFPFPLHMEYGLKSFKFTDPMVIMGIMLTIIIFTYAYRKRNNKIILFSISWFFIALLPVSNLYKINAYMAEHFLYLPSIGFFLITAYLLSIIYNIKRYRMLGVALITCYLLFYSILTIKQNYYWREPIAFYNRTLKFAPDAASIYNNRGLDYSEKGNYDQAILDCNKAIELNPNYAEVYNNLGHIHGKKGNYDQAILDCNKAIELSPNCDRFYNNRGNIYGEKNNYDQAILDYAKAIELNPNYAEAYNNRGVAYGKKGNCDQAILDCNKAIELNPNYAEAYNNRGNAYGEKGNSNQAILDCNKAIELNPNYAEAYNSRGISYNEKGDNDQATLDYTKAIELNSNYAQAYNNRGNAYIEKGKHDQAILDYTKAIEINPSFTRAYCNRAVAYYSKRDYNNAWLDVHKAESLGYKIDSRFLNMLKKASGEGE